MYIHIQNTYIYTYFFMSPLPLFFCFSPGLFTSHLHFQGWQDLCHAFDHQTNARPVIVLHKNCARWDESHAEVKKSDSHTPWNWQRVYHLKKSMGEDDIFFWGKKAYLHGGYVGFKERVCSIWFLMRTSCLVIKKGVTTFYTIWSK